MNDYNFIDNIQYSGQGEYIASIASGPSNKYFIGGNNGCYIPKNQRNDNYFAEKERYEIEKELNEQEFDLSSDLKKESDDYNTRLYLDSMNDGIELDLNSTNIVKTGRIWDGKKLRSVIIRNQNPNFSLYDIYVKITNVKKSFTRKDLIDLSRMHIVIEIGGSQIFCKDFCSTLFFELLNEQDILLEDNILYLKVFTFENMLYGIPNKFLEDNIVIKLRFNNCSKFLIDVIYSGKNLYLPDFKQKHLETMIFEQPIIQTQDTGTEFLYFNKKSVKLAYNHPVQMLMFLPHKEVPWGESEEEPDEPDELEKIELDSIVLLLNGLTTSRIKLDNS